MYIALYIVGTFDKLSIVQHVYLSTVPLDAKILAGESLSAFPILPNCMIQALAKYIVACTKSCLNFICQKFCSLHINVCSSIMLCCTGFIATGS